MSSTNGLSTNNSRSQTNSSMTLDSQTRQNLQAQNQARLLQNIGVIKDDEFTSGGGLNPLKSLYSAAAATFLKNKRGSQTTEKQTNQSQDDSVSAMKALSSSSSGSSSVKWQQHNSNVSGPGSSGAGFSKYAWTGKPGPTGSDAPTSSAPSTDPAADAAAQAAADAAAKAAADAAAKAAADAAAKAAADKAAADAAAAAAAGTPSTYKDSTELSTAFKDQIKALGGSVGKTTGSNTIINVLGMSGTVDQRSDELRVSLNFLGGNISFRLDMSGSMNHYNASGLTILTLGNADKLKDGMGELDRTHVDVVG